MAELGIAASIIAVIQMTGTVTQYLASVKGATKDRQNILNELSTVTGILFILKDQADEAEHDGSWDTTLRALNMPNGPLEQFKAALETLTTKLAPVDGLKKIRKALIWPFQEKEIRDILSTIERQKGLFNLARQNDHLVLTKAIKNDVMSIQDGVDEIGKNIARIQISDHQKDIISWLSAPDPSLNYNNALKARNPKTGTWLIESEVFHSWMSHGSLLLWAYGIPGCGKTILSSTVVQYILDYCRERPRSAVLYFYFDFNEREKQRHENMIRSLITQLVGYQKRTFDVLDSLFNRGRQPTSEELLATLKTMVTAFDEIFLILDALDECTERPELLFDIEEIMRWKDIHLHILVTSRREVDIEESLEPLCDEGTSVCVQSAVVDADIRTYVHDRLSEDKRFKRWRTHTKVQQEIETTLMKKANGMFRWAVCQLDTLCSCVTLPQLRKALQSLPKDLDSTYERILCDIDDTSFAYALKMLRWLTFSARPLFLEEMIEVIAIDVHDDPRFDPERRLPDSRDIMTICSSLITLDAETIAPNHPSISLTPVKLAHFSVKEYLVSDRIRIGKASRYSIREDESDAIIAEDCLAYLLDIDGAILRTREEAITGRISTDFLTAKHQREYPLALYAAEYWTLHAQAAEESDTTETSSLVVELLRSESAAFENWVRIYESGGELFTYTMDDSNYQNDNHLSTEELCRFARSPLHYTSFIGLVKSVRILLEQGYDVNATVDITPGAVSALGAACMGCHMLIVRILLDNGALVNPDKASITSPPLCQASYWGHEEVVRLLLDNGADVNAQTADGSSALQYAFQGEHRGVVQQLLDNGADVNAQGGRYDSALQAASLEGDIETLQLLIEKGANVNAVNAQSNFYGTALYTVSSQGLKEVAQLLIEKGADVNIQAGHYGNALQAASHKGAIETVKLLIEKGANVNAYHSYWGTALQTASYEGSKELALMLIEKGADINARGGIWGRALSAAVAGRSLDVVQLLIVNGADVNAYGEYWRNPLRAAARKGDSEIVQILLDNGAIEVDE